MVNYISCDECPTNAQGFIVSCEMCNIENETNKRIEIEKYEINKNKNY